jgi:hypothetical protein
MRDYDVQLMRIATLFNDQILMAISSARNIIKFVPHYPWKKNKKEVGNRVEGTCIISNNDKISCSMA